MMTAQTTTYTQVFPGDPVSVAAARAFAAKILAGFPGLADAVLLTSELSTNSVLHSMASLPGHTFLVRIIVAGGRWVRVEVSDPGPLPVAPQPRGPVSPVAESGRGWLVVKALAAACARGDCLAWFRLNWTEGVL